MHSELEDTPKLTSLSAPNYSVKFTDVPKDVSDVCFFSAYSFNSTVEEYVYYYLNAIKSAGFSIVFVSTSSLDDTCVQRLSQYAAVVIERENKCPDFGSWKVGLSLFDWGGGLNSVLLANDSVFGPLYDLGEIISAMTKKYDVWGMTDSYEIDYHLQSYFLHFGKKVLKSQLFSNFWENVDSSLSKQEVINRYEVGLSKIFINSNFRVGAYAGVDIVSKSSKHAEKYLNPTLGFWKLLIEQFKFPFLKREVLIRREINRVYWERGIYVNVGTWRKVIMGRTAYPTTHIDAFLDSYYRFIKRISKDNVLKKRKILFLTHNLEIGGAQRVLLNFLAWLKKETDIPFEIISYIPGKKQLLDEFAALGNVTFFNELSDYDLKGLKERLIDDEVALIFSNTIVNVGLQQFLSYLDAPQVVFVHELKNVLNAFSAVGQNVDWLRTNISQFVACADVVKTGLIEYFQVEEEKTSVVHEFVNEYETGIDEDDIRALKAALHIPADAFVVGLCGTFEWRKSADLLPVIAISICKEVEDIHIVWLGADPDSDLYRKIGFDLAQAGIDRRVHLVEKQLNSRPYFNVFDVFLMASREDPFPLVNLESGLAGKPVICFSDAGGTEEYVRLGGGEAVPYMDINAMAGKVLAYYHDRGSLAEAKRRVPEIVRENFTTAVQAPKLLDIICRYYDREEMRLSVEPSITVMTHIYYDNSWDEIKTKLKYFDNGINHFLFSISEACLVRESIIQDIKASFRNAYTLVTSNIGKDIGGKMALIDLYLLLEIRSSYIIFLHDKQSPQTLVGESWKDNLYKIIDPNNYRSIVNILKNETVGIVGAREHIINEYDSNTDLFRHNNDLAKQFLLRFNIAINNYDYLSGTMYWFRASIIEKFFTKHNPISLRDDLEAGNVLDNFEGTVAHTWERMFCWIATNDGYSLKGI